MFKFDGADHIVVCARSCIIQIPGTSDGYVGEPDESAIGSGRAINVITQDGIARSAPPQAERTAVRAEANVRWWRHNVHPQSRVTHKRDVNLASGAVDLILIQSRWAIILHQACAEADGHPQGHVLHKPMGPPRPGGG